MKGGGGTHFFIFFEFLQNFVVGDKLTRAHICKILVFSKKMRDYASQIVTKFSTERKIEKILKAESAKCLEGQISHLPRSTVLTYKRIFCNICEDLNFVSQASNHII